MKANYSVRTRETTTQSQEKSHAKGFKEIVVKVPGGLRIIPVHTGQTGETHKATGQSTLKDHAWLVGNSRPRLNTALRVPTESENQGPKG